MAGSKAGAKKVAVAEMTEAFKNAQATVLTEYRGLKVSEITELRRALGSDVTYTITKNTLTKIAAKDAGVEGLDAQLEGPTALAFVNGDPVNAAKALRDFAKTHPLLVIKGGVMDGNPLSAADLKKLADLESREVLLAKLAGAMNASLSKAVYLFAAPLSKAARTIAALQAVKASEPQPASEVAEAAPAAEAAEAPAEETAEVAEATETVEAVADEAPVEATAEAAPADEAPAEAPEAPAEG